MANGQDGGGLEAILPKGFDKALDTPRDAEAVARLKQACDDAHDAHPGSCSHAVNAVIRAVLGLDQAAWPQRQANDLVGFLAKGNGWAEVTLDRGYELAQHGVVVVGGKAEATTNGHVIVIYPGTRKPAGGYGFTAKDGSLKQVAPRGSYPLAMSTSLGSWPGAKSKGTRTVWDPWAKDAAFAEVRFWAPAAAAAKPDVSGSLRRHAAGRPA